MMWKTRGIFVLSSSAVLLVSNSLPLRDTSLTLSLPLSLSSRSFSLPLCVPRSRSLHSFPSLILFSLALILTTSLVLHLSPPSPPTPFEIYNTTKHNKPCVSPQWVYSLLSSGFHGRTRIVAERCPAQTVKDYAR